MPAGVAKLSIAALKRTISRAGLSTDGLIERRELEAEATRALQILEERFYLKTPRCQGSGCEQKARAGRATFAADYSLGPGEAPLLSFDPGNWEAPFAVPGE